MFFRKSRLAKTAPLLPFPHFVLKKVSPTLSAQCDSIVATANKCFPQGTGVRAVKHGLVRYGHATSQVVALVFAVAIRDARGRELNDIDYGDCALAATFCMRIPFRLDDEAIDEIIDDWLTAFETDMRYLIFTPNETLEDLLEQGNERYLHYERSPEAFMPDAYFHLLATVLRQREAGEWQPYSLLDPMLGPDLILFASLQANWPKVKELVDHWIGTVFEVQELGKKYELEVWEWW